MTAFRYKAFISYSWADAVWGNWLQKAIETYRTPAALVGKDGALGPVPARLHPLFKDREEEAAGASIGAAVETALAASEFLIVVCSPNSAKSKWVDREVAWFKTHRDPAKVLALIVDGEPGGGERECFPRALTHRVLPDLSITDQAEDAPLAADARDSGDGKRKARLKIAAALLGVGLDELVRRDDRRRTLRVRLVVGGSLALALAMSALALAAVRARDEADFQRAESDGLVEFMLTDLREKLEPVGRLDALDVVGQRALKYYAGQKASKLDADALGRRARALHLVGEVSNIRGDSAAGLTAFREAAATTGEQLARDPDNPQRIFDHAQSVFWVGAIAYERGETKEAEAQFREYKRLADRLVAINPNNPEWQMEVSYAENTLGILLFDQGRFTEAEPAFARGLQMVEAVAAYEKGKPARQIEVGLAMNGLARAISGNNRIAESIRLFRSEIAVYQKILKSDPSNTQAKLREAVAWQYLGQLEEIEGHAEASLFARNTSLALILQLRAIEPGNTEWQETQLRGMIGKFDSHYFLGQRAQAQAVLQQAQPILTSLEKTDPSNTIWAIGLRATLDVRAGRLALANGDAAGALNYAESATKAMARGKGFDVAEAARIDADIVVLTGDALARGGRAADAAKAWEAGLARLSGSSKDFLSKILLARFFVLKRLGRRAEAMHVASLLDRQGYRHPAYLRER